MIFCEGIHREKYGHCKLVESSLERANGQTLNPDKLKLEIQCILSMNH